MTARSILNQLLQSGQGIAADLSKAGQSTGGTSQVKNMLSGATGGLLGGGALALLLSSKKARKIGGSAVKYGGVAALGALAYRAFSDWQANQNTANVSAPAASVPPAAQPALASPQTLDRIPAPQAEQHSRAVLAAMIGAAKADGHIGDKERQQLDAALAHLSDGPQDHAWLAAELAKPLDPVAIARLSETPEMAAEMYLASLIVIDDESFMERAYVDELARQLQLAPELQTQLRSQVRQAELA